VRKGSVAFVPFRILRAAYSYREGGIHRECGSIMHPGMLRYRPGRAGMNAKLLRGCYRRVLSRLCAQPKDIVGLNVDREHSLRTIRHISDSGGPRRLKETRELSCVAR
jgi:hypothetical protein